MIVIKSAGEAQASMARHTTGDGLVSTVVTYFGLPAPGAVFEAPRVGEIFPVAFRVEMDPLTQAEPHFHQANQFQVFIAGGGRLGKRDVRPVTVQYADAYTPYGPITAGAEGISYLTLRNSWDPGASFMPGARDKLKAFARKPRALTADPVEPATVPATVEKETVLAQLDDGLGAWRYRLGAGASFSGPDPALGGGQYWVVLAGEEVGNGTPLGEQSCLFLSPDAGVREAVAGAGGLDVLVMQFPRF